MKIVLLEGEDITKSRERYFKIITSLKKRGWEIQHIQNDLKNTLQNSSTLFSKNILYILENSTKISTNELKWLNENHKNSESQLLIYQRNVLPQTTKKLLPKETKVEKFDLPKVIFKFLDSFQPKNSKDCLKLFHETISNNPPEFVLALLTRRLKDMYILSQDPTSLKLPSWQLTRLRSQTSKFTPKLIEAIISELALSDIKSKTGKAYLTTSFDLVITKHLK